MIVNGTDETHVPLNPMLYMDGPTEFIVHSMGKLFAFTVLFTSPATIRN